MRIPGLKGLKWAARNLRSRFVRSGLILAYHRIAETTHDSFEMSVTPQHFAEQLEVLHRYAHPISLQALVQGVRDGNLLQQAVALTFDDGYADNLYQARPLLERYQVPATVFVATGYIGGEFWWDELERILMLPPTLPEKPSLSLDNDIYEWGAGNLANARQGLLQALYKRLLPLSAVEREPIMDQLRAWAGTETTEKLCSRAMTADELVEWTTGGLLEVGAHTVTHPMLATLSVEAQEAEIRHSKSCLDELLGQSVTAFSYPNGSASKETRTIVKNLGFTCACTSYNDVVWRGSDPFYLPRFWIPNWGGETFSRWLKWWL